MDERKNSEARIKANNRYNEKAYDRINIAIPKGRKTELQAIAASKGESLNKYVTAAIDERVVRDNASGVGDNAGGVSEPAPIVNKMYDAMMKASKNNESSNNDVPVQEKFVVDGGE